MVIPPSQLVEIFGGNTNCLHTLKAECKRLFNTTVEFDKGHGGFKLLHLFRVLEYKPRDGLHLKFESLLRPYLLDLVESEGFTKIDVEQIFFFNVNVCDTDSGVDVAISKYAADEDKEEDS